jgi:hypothetical protein
MYTDKVQMKQFGKVEKSPFLPQGMFVIFAGGTFCILKALLFLVIIDGSWIFKFFYKPLYPNIQPSANNP